MRVFTERFTGFLILAVVLLFLLFYLSGCSQRYHCLKCLSGGNVIRDTVRLDTTIFVPEIRIDSVLVFDLSTDTLILHQDRVIVKVRDIPGPTVFVSVKCPPDSVVVEKEVLVPVEVNTGYSKGKVIGFGIAAIIAALVVGAGIMRLFGR